jgi:Ca-activated chloride channel family protein
MKSATAWLITAGLVVSGHCAAYATGALVPNNPHIQRPPRNGIFSVRSQHINVDIDGQVASTSIEQVFTNNTQRILEATYLFPIPDDVAVSSFSMWMNGEEVQGQVVDAGKARRVYEGIVRRTRDPGLLEYVGRNLFQARVYPVPAGGDVRIRIEYDELLDYQSGLVSYTCPLKTDHFKFGNIGELGLAVKISSDIPIKSLYSPTHEIDRRIADGEAYCGFEETDVCPNADFQLFYTVSESDVAMNLITHRVEGEDGYFMLLVAPGELVDDEKVIPKDIVFVIDRSGSMEGVKIEQARRALKWCVSRMGEEDRFNIVSFATSVETFRGELVTADEKNRKDARDFIDDIEARGGTDIHAALSRALDLPPSMRPQMIVFLTDGLPTVGVTLPSLILSNLEFANDQQVRVFPFGLGYDVNTRLLDQIADEHRGLVQYVEPSGSVDEAVTGFYDKISNPVLADVSLGFSDIEITDMYPRDLPDVFYGSQMVVVGRYRGGGPTQVMLEGNVRNKRQTRHYDAEFTGSEAEAPFVARLWAGRKVAWLQSEIKINGRNPELVDEIKLLSTEHGIITPYTSYLVLEPGSEHLLADGGQRDRLETMPADGVVDAVSLEPRVVTRSDIHARGGRSSEIRIQTDGVSVEDPLGSIPLGGGKKAEFEESRHISRTKADEIARLPTEEKFRYVEGTTFVRTEHGWRDLAFRDGEDVVEIEYLSDEYFEMLQIHPKVKKYLALGERVEFVLDDKKYRIKPAPDKDD